jgi:hypothetical protein
MLIDILKLKNKPYKDFYVVRINETGHHSRQFNNEDDAMNCLRIINDVLEEEGYEVTESVSDREDCICSVVAKKKVFVLTNGLYEDQTILGVFNLEPKAKQFAEEKNLTPIDNSSGNQNDSYGIDEYEVDELINKK